MVVDVHHARIRLVKLSFFDQTLHPVITALVILSVDQHCKQIGKWEIPICGILFLKNIGICHNLQPHGDQFIYGGVIQQGFYLHSIPLRV